MKILFAFTIALSLGGPACSRQDDGADDAAPAATTPPAAADEGTDFLRFVEDERGARLESALVQYADEKGRSVALVGALHVADAAYYDELDELFPYFDAVLYELVAERGTVPGADDRRDSSVSGVQRLVKDVLELEFQLDAVDYRADNFVHADLDPKRLAQLMDEKGESLFVLLLRGAMAEQARAAETGVAPAHPMALLMAFAAPDRARALKLVLGRQFEDMERMVAGFEKGSTGEGSVLVGERNKAAMDVLEEQLEAGKTKLAIFYGAAHLPDMERRLERMGFAKRSTSWLTAWDIPLPPPPPAPPAPTNAEPAAPPAGEREDGGSDDG